MIQSFFSSRNIEMNTAMAPSKHEAHQSHYQILEQLAGRKMFPEVYVDLLNTLDSDDDKSLLSKKLVKIYLYAATKIKDPYKLYNWLLKGSLPQSMSQGGDSMALLNQNAIKIKSLGKSRDKTIDKLNVNRSKLSIKSTKKQLDVLNKNRDKLEVIENQFKNQKELIENIILEIESSLASGTKL